MAGKSFYNHVDI